MTYAMPEHLAEVRNVYDAAGNLASFLLKNTGTVYGEWRGRIAAADQRKLFGKVITGKCEAYFNGATETITIARKVCFGTDVDYTRIRWIEMLN